ncbi:MAG: type II secretion system protein [Candidatus Omnitrophica bacterium]|nr:type II secretion system protein [Candidatus Omnitrophota bacterium]
MCILQPACKKNKDRGVTLTEILVVLVITVILITLAGASFSWRMEREAEKNAKIYLNLSWQAEQNYFAWKNGYTLDWKSLDAENPNRIDTFYVYTIDKATSDELFINATRRNKNRGFAINESGNITNF